jgi:hypothetical protein
LYQFYFCAPYALIEPKEYGADACSKLALYTQSGGSRIVERGTPVKFAEMKGSLGGGKKLQVGKKRLNSVFDICVTIVIQPTSKQQLVVLDTIVALVRRYINIFTN